MNQQPNRLINEKSPYLLQHAYNPIDWYPWSDEAFLKAKQEDKPIFLSIGYSVCHWCHVMERESFEDEEVAELLNNSFIAIKVDREERPDIDSIYMDVAQVINGSGGWPLTIIMTPDQVPFFAATYVPKSGNEQFYGLIEILTLIETRWRVKRAELLNSADKVKEYFKIRSGIPNVQEIDPSILDKTYEQLLENYDPIYGGFGKAPKFPSPHTIMYLIRYSIMKKDQYTLDMVHKTLKSMVKGAMYDQIGFGFARYSVDEQWLIPHFEKMCYDNALLTISYIEAYLHTKDELYKKVAIETLTFVERELMDSKGGFYTAIDADSEGVEGKYYVWTLDEIKAVLDPNEAERIIDYYKITERGNFEGSNALNLLHISDNNLLHIETDEIKRIKKKLLKAREQRVHPHLDDKILTSNNAMMIIAFTHAYMAFEDEKYLDIAVDSMDFILSNLVDHRGRLLARYRDGEAKFNGYADDYAYMVWALLDLFLATGNLSYLEKALNFNSDLIQHFYDDEHGGFFFTANDHEELLFRSKDAYDGAVPSANSVIALNLIRIAEITDEPMFENLAVKQFKSFGSELTESPTSYLFFLSAYLLYKVPKRKIVLVTDEVDQKIKYLQQIVWDRCIPCTQMITLKRKDIEHSELFSYYLEDTAPIALHICENYLCNEPIYDYDQMKEELKNLILSRLK